MEFSGIPFEQAGFSTATSRPGHAQQDTRAAASLVVRTGAGELETTYSLISSSRPSKPGTRSPDLLKPFLKVMRKRMSTSTFVDIVKTIVCNENYTVSASAKELPKLLAAHDVPGNVVYLLGDVAMTGRANLTTFASLTHVASRYADSSMPCPPGTRIVIHPGPASFIHQTGPKPNINDVFLDVVDWMGGVMYTTCNSQRLTCFVIGWAEPETLDFVVHIVRVHTASSSEIEELIGHIRSGRFCDSYELQVHTWGTESVFTGDYRRRELNEGEAITFVDIQPPGPAHELVSLTQLAREHDLIMPPSALFSDWYLPLLRPDQVAFLSANVYALSVIHTATQWH